MNDEEPIDLDELHATAVDAAQDLDRDYAERHPDARFYLRPGLAHEMCIVGEPCRFVPWIRVWFVAPGLRGRIPA